MSFYFLLKIVSDLGFFFAVATAFLCTTSCDTSSLVPLIAVSLSVTLGYWLDGKKPALRYIALLGLPLAFIGWPRDLWTTLIIAVACIYGGLHIFWQRFSLSHDERLQFLSLAVKVLPVCLVPFGIFIPGMPTLYIFIRYVLIFAVPTLILTQVLRHSPTILVQRRLKLGIISCVILLSLVILFFSSGLFWTVVLWLAKFFYQWVIIPIIMVIAVVIWLIVWVLFTLLPIKPGTEDKVTEAMTQFAKQYQQIEPNEVTPSIDPLLLNIIKVSVGVIVLVILILFFRKMLKNRRYDRSMRAEESRSTITTPRDFRSEKEPRDTHPPVDPREAVRYHYRHFMRACRSIGILIPNWATSLEVEREARKLFPIEHQQQLQDTRRIYLRARYSNHPIDRKDVKTIRENVEQLQKDRDEIENRM